MLAWIPRTAQLESNSLIQKRGSGKFYAENKRNTCATQLRRFPCQRQLSLRVQQILEVHL